MSVFLQTNHLFLRNPSGEVENMAAARDAGFGVALANVGDYPESAWDLIRDNADRAGIIFAPWLRTQGADKEFDPQKLLHLIDVADLWGVERALRQLGEGDRP